MNVVDVNYLKPFIRELPFNGDASNCPPCPPIGTMPSISAVFSTSAASSNPLEKAHSFQPVLSEHIRKQASQIQLLCEKLDIREGSFLARRNSNRLISLIQFIFNLFRGTYYQNCHVSVVTKIGKHKITVLESSKSGHSGVKVNKFTIEQFRNYVALDSSKRKGLGVMNHPSLTTHVAGQAQRMASYYEKNTAGYAWKNFLTVCLLSSRDNEEGRMRTRSTFQGDGGLKNSDGTVRAKAICSELVTEILKMAQLSLGVPMADLHSKRTTPRRFVQAAVDLGFVYSIITRDKYDDCRASLVQPC